MTGMCGLIQMSASPPANEIVANGVRKVGREPQLLVKIRMLLADYTDPISHLHHVLNRTFSRD